MLRFVPAPDRGSGYRRSPATGKVQFMAFTRGQTAVIVPIPAAEPLVGHWRAQLDPAAAVGVPAHVTLIYPFLDQEHLTSDVLYELVHLVAGHLSFSVTFTGCGTFPDVLYLAPEPEGPFRRLTEDLVLRWPEAPPYGGTITDPTPHLTITHGTQPEQAAKVAADVAAQLPLTVRIEHAALFAFDGTTWSLRKTLLLGPDGTA